MKFSPTRPRGRRWTGVLSLTAVLVLTAVAAANAEPPLVTVGSNGDTNACANNQQASVTPSAGTSTGALKLAGGQCVTSGTPSSGGGGGGAPSPSGGSDQGGGGGGTNASTSAGTTSSSATTSTANRTTSSRSAAAATTVPAAKASGVRITAVRYRTFAGKRVGVSVRVRDRQHRLVRNAIVTLSGIAGAKPTLVIPRSTYTNPRGQASFVLPLRSKLSGKRLLMRITARTPTARVSTIGSRIVPGSLIR